MSVLWIRKPPGGAVAFKTNCQRCGKVKRTPEVARNLVSQKISQVEREMTNLDKQIDYQHECLFEIENYIVELAGEKMDHAESIQNLRIEMAK